jgi:asparagine synthase (glutamine-hydrolysing)
MGEPMVSHDCAFYLLSRGVNTAKWYKAARVPMNYSPGIITGVCVGCRRRCLYLHRAFFDRDHDEYAACVQPAWLTGDAATTTMRRRANRCGCRRRQSGARLNSTVLV